MFEITPVITLKISAIPGIMFYQIYYSEWYFSCIEINRMIGVFLKLYNLNECVKFNHSSEFEQSVVYSATYFWQRIISFCICIYNVTNTYTDMYSFFSLCLQFVTM